MKTKQKQSPYKNILLNQLTVINKTWVGITNKIFNNKKKEIIRF